MKSLVALAALAAAAAVAAPASAQSLTSFAPVTFNAGAGYTGIAVGNGNIGAATLRAGADFGKYFGLEGEGSWGVVDHDAYVNGTTTFTKRHLNDQYAGYGVVRYPFLSNANVFVRGGYGHSDLKVAATDLSTNTGPTVTAGRDSWNYGGGGEYLVDGKNGVRLDFTHFDFVGHGQQNTADTWSLSYVHKF